MNTPEAPPPYRPRPAAQLADPTAPLRWLPADLFLVGAAGSLGGAPKTGKGFFALELAVAVGPLRPPPAASRPSRPAPCSSAPPKIRRPASSSASPRSPPPATRRWPRCRSR